MRSRVLILLAVATFARAASGPATLGGVRGHVVLPVEGARLVDAGPLVVYLDGIDGALDYEVPADVPRISQKNATFSPPFLVVARGQTVEMPNDDLIFHNVFSYSHPNEIDLGLYAKGKSKSVTFEHAGAVRLYCSIHESMNGLIFVAPSPYHAIAEPSGAFAIRGAPPGRYRLRTWNQRLPEATRDIEVQGGRDTEVDLPIGGG